MWQQVLSSPTEQVAFTSLLSEYFSRPPPQTPSSAPPPTATRRLPPTNYPTSPPRSVNPPPILSSSNSPPPPPPPAPQESFSSRLQTAAAGSVLRNTTATSSALRQAGLSQSASNSLAGLGKKHHEVLAPHLASAARQGYKMQQGGAGGEEEGPKRPGGLQAGKSMAGVGDTSSAKGFTKALFSSKGALSKQEQDKQKYTGPLYVKPPTAPGTISHKPPPRRGGAVGAVESEEKVRASYDYDGGELEDLPCREGEELVVVERVGADWIKCRNASGAEGLVPSSYTQAI
ncbi:hypothetical protein JCM5353_003393 [Sporobolomyces roseus]